MSEIRDAKIAYDRALENVNKFYGSQRSTPERYKKWVGLLEEAEKIFDDVVVSHIKGSQGNRGSK